MARYIDSEPLLNRYVALENIDWNQKVSPPSWSYAYKSFIDYLLELPTADVVPGAEVDEIIYKLECLLCHATGGRLSKHTYELRTMETAVTDYINESYEDGVTDGSKNAAREICCKIEEEIVAALESNYKAKSERLTHPHVDMADEFVSYCEGKISALLGIGAFVENLKKKYIERGE